VGSGLLLANLAVGREIYLAPNGNDTDAGDIDRPFASFNKAIAQVRPGDTIIVRGGTYWLTDTLNIRAKNNGTAEQPITLKAADGETPVLDFSNEPDGQRGISLRADHWRIVGLDIRNAKDNGVHIEGSHNVLERLSIHDNGDSGLQLSGSDNAHPSNNLILNTDSFRNYDKSSHGENADGFAAKFAKLGKDNVFRGCRAYYNSDDGWDFWKAPYGVTVENCWGVENGYDRWGDAKYEGDGNGIKLGHDSGRHVVKGCIFLANAGNGVDVNGNAFSRNKKLLAAASQPASTQPANAIAHGVSVRDVLCVKNRLRNFVFDEPFAHQVTACVSIDGGMPDEIDPLVRGQTGFSLIDAAAAGPNAGKAPEPESAPLLAPRGTQGELPILPRWKQ
jgi:hypothetical protein